METFFHTTEDKILISIKAIPGASKNEFAGIRDNRLCVRVAAAPEDGKANSCLCEFLAKTLGCAKRDVVPEKGEKSRLKVIAVPAACGDKLKKITNQQPRLEGRGMLFS